jgi:hypothetical protein
MLSNHKIVEAFTCKEGIADALKRAKDELHALQEHVAKLEELNAGAIRTTEVFNGVALEVDEDFVRPVSYAIPRSAQVFEHVRDTGSFRVMTIERNGPSRIHTIRFDTRDTAFEAAKAFVTSL